MTPQDHYDAGLACMETLLAHKDDELFSSTEANTLARCAQAHALLGILKFLGNGFLPSGRE